MKPGIRQCLVRHCCLSKGKRFPAPGISGVFSQCGKGLKVRGSVRQQITEDRMGTQNGKRWRERAGGLRGSRLAARRRGQILAANLKEGCSFRSLQNRSRASNRKGPISAFRPVLGKPAHRAFDTPGTDILTGPYGGKSLAVIEHARRERRFRDPRRGAEGIRYQK